VVSRGKRNGGEHTISHNADFAQYFNQYTPPAVFQAFLNYSTPERLPHAGMRGSVLRSIIRLAPQLHGQILRNYATREKLPQQGVRDGLVFGIGER
jgi:hypothetical protein